MEGEFESGGKLSRIDRFFQWILSAPVGAPEERKKVPVGIRDTLALYWVSLRKFPKTIAFVVVTSIVGGLGTILIPYVFKLFLDAIAKTKPDEYLSLLPYVWLLFAVALVRWLVWRSNFIVMAGLAARMIADLKERAFSHLIAHSDRFFSSNFTGSLVQRVNRFAASYDRLADRLIMDIIPTALQVVGIVWILAREEKLIALVVFVWLLIAIVWNWTFARWKLRYDIARAAADSRSTGYLADVITNHQTVELFHSHKREEAGYANVIERQTLLQRFSWQSSSLIDGIQAFLMLFVEFGVFYIGIHLWGEGKFSVGLFVLAQAYIVMLSERLWTFSRMIREIHESFADAKEMAEIMLLPHEITEERTEAGPPRAKGAITYKNVTFSFEGKKILDNVSFSVTAGERVALVGPSGAGKSTIVKLLFRQYDPTDGEIFIDGMGITKTTLAVHRNILCLVPQEPLLFHRTLLENIRYSRPEATDTDVHAAALAANAEEFIAASPDGYGTYVGERGIKLSGGERQRIAIARAFLKGSPVIVFDEATSSLDSESEQRIQDALDKLMRDRTTIVISHRLSTIKRMDRIIVVDGGRVVEEGTHEELLERKGVYERLWALQQGGFLAEASS
jgi:ATP-binding cassette, subfamily B, bacterial